VSAEKVITTLSLDRSYIYADAENTLYPSLNIAQGSLCRDGARSVMTVNGTLLPPRNKTQVTSSRKHNIPNLTIHLQHLSAILVRPRHSAPPPHPQKQFGSLASSAFVLPELHGHG